MSWIDVLIAIWGLSAVIVTWCYITSMREQKDSADR